MRRLSAGSAIAQNAAGFAQRAATAFLARGESDPLLITGTSSGFGKDAAITLAEAGHRVFATMRDTADRHRAVAAALGAQGISETITTGQMRGMFDVNVFGIQRTTRAVLPAMRGARAPELPKIA